VGEGFLRRDIPTLVGGMGRVGVDDDEAVLGGQRGVLAAAEGGFGRSVAPVRVNEDGRIGGEGVGDVDEEAGFGWVGTEVFSDLAEGGC